MNDGGRKRGEWGRSMEEMEREDKEREREEKEKQEEEEEKEEEEEEEEKEEVEEEEEEEEEEAKKEISQLPGRNTKSNHSPEYATNRTTRGKMRGTTNTTLPPSHRHHYTPTHTHRTGPQTTIHADYHTTIPHAHTATDAHTVTDTHTAMNAHTVMDTDTTMHTHTATNTHTMTHTHTAMNAHTAMDAHSAMNTHNVTDAHTTMDAHTMTDTHTAMDGHTVTDIHTHGTEGGERGRRERREIPGRNLSEKGVKRETARKEPERVIDGARGGGRGGGGGGRGGGRGRGGGGGTTAVGRGTVKVGVTKRGVVRARISKKNPSATAHSVESVLPPLHPSPSPSPSPPLSPAIACMSNEGTQQSSHTVHQLERHFRSLRMVRNPPPCDARRREKVGALYSAVSGLLAIVSRAYVPSISLPCATEYCKSHFLTVLYFSKLETHQNLTSINFGEQR